MLRIRDWGDIYENSRSREIKNLSYVCMPNSHDGSGYAAVLDHPNGPCHFGAWCAIVQVASKCKPRGVLVRGNGKAHDAASLAAMTHFPKSVYEESLPRFLSEDIHWLEDVTPQAAGVLPRSAVGGDRKEGTGQEGDARELADAGLLDRLIDAWNALPYSIIASRVEARRSEEIVKGWKKVRGTTGLRDKFNDVGAVAAAIRTATFCHAERWFVFAWLFQKSGGTQWNIIKLLEGRYADKQRKLKGVIPAEDVFGEARADRQRASVDP